MINNNLFNTSTVPNHDRTLGWREMNSTQAQVALWNGRELDYLNGSYSYDRDGQDEANFLNSMQLDFLGISSIFSFLQSLVRV